MAILNKNFTSDGAVDYVYFHLNGGCSYDKSNFIFKVESTTIDPDWLIVSVDSAAKRFVIQAQPNYALSVRNGKIIPKYNGDYCENNAIMVKQDAKQAADCYIGSESAYTYTYYQYENEDPIPFGEGERALPCNAKAGDYVISATCVIKTCDSSCNCPTEEKTITFTVPCYGPNDEEESRPLLRLPYRDNGSTIWFMQAAGPCVYTPKASILYEGVEKADTFVKAGQDDTFIINYWGENTAGGKTTDGLKLTSGSSVDWIEEVEINENETGKLQKKFKTSPNTTTSERAIEFYSYLEETPTSKSSNVKVSQLVSGSGGTLYIPPFDYLTFVFEWDSTGGIDLDSATFVNVDSIKISGNKGLNKYPVGFNCVGSDEGYIPTEIGGRAVVNEVGKYLQHGGDNWTSGDESSLINFKKVLELAQTDITCDLYGNWYTEKSDGRCRVIVRAYKGGSMRQSGYLFVPTNGAEQVFEGQITGTVEAYSSTNSQDGDGLDCNNTEKKRENYTHIAKFTYSKEFKSCVVTPIFSGGTVLIGHVSVEVDGQNIEGDTDCSGTTVLSYNGTVDSTGGTVTISINDVYDEDNGERVDVDFTNTNPRDICFWDVDHSRPTTPARCSIESNVADNKLNLNVIIGENRMAARDLVVRVMFPRTTPDCNYNRNIILYYKIKQS